MSCQTCESAIIECGTALERYSLQEDEYFYSFLCPPGASCGGNDVLYMDCCDGARLKIILPAGATAEFRDQVYQQLVAEYWRRWKLCQTDGTNDPGDDPAGDPTDPTDPVLLYYNQDFSCTAKCSDGLIFTYTVRAGMFAGASQDKANYSAREYACQQAKLRKICLGSLPTEWCSGVAFSKSVVASGAFLDTHFNFWTLSGTLPPGLDLKYQGYGPVANPITGTPTTAGNYTFTVTVRDRFGDWMAKTYTICIVGITSNPAGSDAAHMPDAEFGVDYLATLQATSCADTPLSWQIVSGSLPLGLSLDEETGVVSGTCLEDPGDYTFTVQLQTNAT